MGSQKFKEFYHLKNLSLFEKIPIFYIQQNHDTFDRILYRFTGILYKGHDFL